MSKINSSRRIDRRLTRKKRKRGQDKLKTKQSTNPADYRRANQDHPNSVFVYGTLMSGEPLNSLLVDGGAVKTPNVGHAGGFLMFDLGVFPGIVPSDRHPEDLAKTNWGQGGVRGEVWEVSDELLKALDDVEGVPRLYRRERITVNHAYAKNQTNTVWAYVYNGIPNKLISCGSWKDRDGKPYRSKTDQIRYGLDNV